MASQPEHVGCSRIPEDPSAGILEHRCGARSLKLIILFISLWVVLPPTPCSAENPLVITHLDVQTHILGVNSLRAMIAKRQHGWPDGQAVHVFVLPDDHPVHIRFAKVVLGVFPHQLRLAWDRQVFSGTAQAPTRVTSEREMLERVATTPGAIGYVNKEVANARVRVLAVE